MEEEQRKLTYPVDYLFKGNRPGNHFEIAKHFKPFSKMRSSRLKKRTPGMVA